MKHTKLYLFLLLLSLSNLGRTQPVLEKLNRGLVAVAQSDGNVFLSWRLLGTDPEGIAFNVYKNMAGQQTRKLNEKPVTQSTNYVDSTENNIEIDTYFVSPVRNQKELAPSNPVKVWAQPYLSIPLRTPEGYTPNDASVGDLDGDGTYEIVLHQAGKSHDNSHTGYTDAPILEAYRLDGTMLWRINLGKNIREGAHYTQFMVYDLDGDGKAEVACKTADGTLDGQGKVIGDAHADWRNADGRILDGPEYFTIFDGETGAALATTDYIPGRGDLSGWGGVGGNGGNDRNGNRVDRFLACVAYLDGKLPSVIMCRGYYGRTVLAAWDWRKGELRSRWVFDSGNRENPYSGMGNHNLTVADVDRDGKDEIIYGAMCIDDNGQGLYTTGLRHGDALHVSNLNPGTPDLEVWGIHENEEPVPGYENGFGKALFNARTGEILWGDDAGKDVGRGLAADIDPRFSGAEMWTNSGELYACTGERLGTAPGSTNFAIWWDGDLLREILDQNKITKWDWQNSKEIPLLTAEGCLANNGTKATPALSADLWGDWREEVIFRTDDNLHLRVYTTIIPTTHRLYTLMHNRQYRLSIAWQNVGYNQPPHTSFFLGHGMDQPEAPAMDIRGEK